MATGTSWSPPATAAWTSTRGCSRSTSSTTRTGADYLVSRADRADERDAAAELSHALGGLPLALAHAGAYCARGIGFADYQALLTLPAPELYRERPEAFYRETVASTWTASIDAASQQAPEARAALAITAYLAPTDTPVALVLDALGDTGNPSRRLQSLDALRALDTFSLIDLHGDELDTHRLLQKVIRDDAHERQDQAASTSALDALTRAFPGDVARPASWPRCATLLPQVTAYADTTPSDENAERTVALLNRAVDYLLKAGDAARATVSATTAVELGERLLGREHPDMLTARANLAFCYWQAGRTGEAITMEEAVLADSERLLGTEHLDTLTARANLASSYQQAGRTGEAITLKEAVLADSERLLGSDHLDTLTARANLAVSYGQAGRTGDAIILLEGTLADRQRLLGAEHPDTLTARANLAVSYQQTGRTNDAITLGEAVLADRERLLGPDHPNTLTARANLASSYRQAGRTSEAITLEEAVLADRERLLGAEHPDTLTARGNLAVSNWQAGRIGRGDHSLGAGARR